MRAMLTLHYHVGSIRQPRAAAVPAPVATQGLRIASRTSQVGGHIEGLKRKLAQPFAVVTRGE